MDIEVKNVYKVFRTDSVQTHALSDVSLKVKDGEFVAIMGPSGCGKSTLLNILGLLDNPTSGEYLLDGKEVGGLKEMQRTEWRKGRIGFIFQSFNLIEEMTVRENIMLPLNNIKLSRDEKRRRVDEAMKRMGIAHRAAHYPSQLSGGQQQRAGAEVMELLTELHRDGATIIMVTHSQKDAGCADYIINLFDGRIVENLADRM